MFSELPIPSHFDKSQIPEVWKVPYMDLAEQAEVWAEKHRIIPAAQDKKKVVLLLIDEQNSFCTPGFELFVEGAPEDSKRVCEFIYRNLGTISQIACTLDTHRLMQIFYPMFFINGEGKHPSPGTQISVSDIETGVWKVNPAVASIAEGNYIGLSQYVLHYVKQLAEGKVHKQHKEEQYDLTIWPYHTMLGSIGYALVSAIESACFFHGVVRHSQTQFEIKGLHPLTESYSVFVPEVTTGPAGEAMAQRNVRFIQLLLEAYIVIIAGQAKSHCLAWTVADLLGEVQAQEPALAKKVYLLEDCTSPVVIPNVMDYTQEADEAFKRFADAGMHIVQSTDLITSWPDVVLD